MEVLRDELTCKTGRMCDENAQCTWKWISGLPAEGQYGPQTEMIYQRNPVYPPNPYPVNPAHPDHPDSDN